MLHPAAVERTDCHPESVSKHLQTEYGILLNEGYPGSALEFDKVIHINLNWYIDSNASVNFELTFFALVYSTLL
jgi:hypothetical protein